ncbi:MAG: NADP-dependent malic enzyme [Arenicella sp.]
MSNDLKNQALHYHESPKPGKVRVQATKPLSNQRDLALAYSPGVAAPCEAIVENPTNAAKYTSRGNLVGVVTNGTAVLGLGNIGPLASKPVMEGKAILFKHFADVDSFDIEVNELDVDKFCDIVAALEPTFGGINLEDIKAPECFEIERRLRERMNIPVFHDDQHGTAIVTAAAVVNGLRLVEKDPKDIKLVVSGAGSAAIACTNLLLKIGVKVENVFMCDSRGVIHSERENLTEEKKQYANKTDARTLEDAMHDADIFLGLSFAGLVSQDMVKSMADRPLILAMANPTPEIMPEEIKAVRDDAIIATGRSDFPNQVNNVLCFPFLFRGALDVGATTINEEMKIACVHAIADLAKAESTDVVAKYYQGEALVYGPEYILPKPFDPRLVTSVAPAVAQAAIDSGVAARPFENIETYRKSLLRLVYRSGSVMRPIFERAEEKPKRIVYNHGSDERVLRGMQVVINEGYAKPILIAEDKSITASIERFGLSIKPGIDFDVVAPSENLTKQASDMVKSGEADAALIGPYSNLYQQAEDIQDCIGIDSRLNQYAAMQMLILEDGLYFVVDMKIHEDPTAEELATITELAAEEIRRFGITPRAALLSHSNYGSRLTKTSEKMLKAAEILQEKCPDLEIDGPIQVDVAFDNIKRKRMNPDTKLQDKANLLVMPNVDCANIAFKLLKHIGDAISVGPMLLGSPKPVHLIGNATSSRGVVNLSAILSASCCEDE